MASESHTFVFRIFSMRMTQPIRGGMAVSVTPADMFGCFYLTADTECLADGVRVNPGDFVAAFWRYCGRAKLAVTVEGSGADARVVRAVMDAVTGDE